MAVPDIPTSRVGFLVVGSARSGTTLVQRLACEISGVGMPPETHFFSAFASDLLHRRRFPLGGADLEQELQSYGRTEGARGLGLDTRAVIEDLHGEADSPFDLFESIVRTIAPAASVLGEKTPDHLLWWPALSEAVPWLRFVVCVRDPRAVVSSALQMPWQSRDEISSFGGRAYLALATRWDIDQRAASELSATLGPDRCLVLRYEDVVVDPDLARARIATLLGIEGHLSQRAPTDIVLPWEGWKQSALEEVRTDRTKSWEVALTPRRAGEIASICRGGMMRFAYTDGLPAASRAAYIRSRLGRAEKRDLRLLRASYRRYEHYVRGLTL
jgi:Sulfotransferase family